MPRMNRRNKAMSSLLNVIIALSSVPLVQTLYSPLVVNVPSSAPCARRYYPLPQSPDNFVCVCNATYCDEYEDIQPSANLAVVYSSSENGDRMNAKAVRLSRGGSIQGGKITVNPSVTYQEIIGFGGAFSDAAGARYSTGRVPMSSTDFSTRIYSYNDKAGDTNMTNFALAQEDLMYKIPLITRALNLTRGDLRLFSSPWSAPAWMKSSGKMEGPGTLKAGLESAWAKYFVRFFEAYLAHGIAFWATTVQNEPFVGFLTEWAWQAMGWNATGEASFVVSYLGPALAGSDAAKNVKIIAMDDGRWNLSSWANTVYSDPAASSFISGVGVHWYFEEHAPASVLSTTYQAHPDKFILGTEDLNHFVAGWTDWNMALDKQGGPNWANNYVDSPIIVDAAADEFLKQPMHYAMTHFSRFVRPGAKRVQSITVGINKATVMHTAFVSGDQRIVVILNTNNVEQSIAIEEAAGPSIPLKIAPKSITTVLWNKQY